MDDKKIMDYINKPQQEAFVRGVIHDNHGNTQILCWSPVYKFITITEGNYIDVKRGDTIIVEPEKTPGNQTTYSFVKNKTLDAEMYKWIDKTLSEFTDVERNKILLVSMKQK